MYIVWDEQYYVGVVNHLQVQVYDSAEHNCAHVVGQTEVDLSKLPMDEEIDIWLPITRSDKNNCILSSGTSSPTSYLAYPTPCLDFYVNLYLYLYISKISKYQNIYNNIDVTFLIVTVLSFISLTGDLHIKVKKVTPLGRYISQMDGFGDDNNNDNNVEEACCCLTTTTTEEL